MSEGLGENVNTRSSAKGYRGIPAETIRSIFWSRRGDQRRIASFPSKLRDGNRAARALLWNRQPGGTSGTEQI